MKNKKEMLGISLLVLVITIVVIIILSGVVILNVTKNNPISNAQKAKFLSDLDIFKTQLELYISNKHTDTLGGYNRNKLNATKEKVQENGKEDTNRNIKDIIPAIGGTKYEENLEVKEGKIIYIGKNKDEVQWSIENGIDTTAINIDIIVLEDVVSISGNIKLTGSIVDVNKIEVYEIYVAKKNEEYKVEPSKVLTQKNSEVDYIIEGLKTGTTYKIKVKVVIDGRKYQKEITNVTTIYDDIPPNVSDITASVSPNTWTNQNVSVTLNNIPGDAIVKQYTKPGSNTWNNYTGTFSVSQNGTINIRVEDEAGNEATKTILIEKIDKLEPASVTFSPNSASNVKDVTVNITASDQVGTSTSGNSGIKLVKYQWRNTNGIISISDVSWNNAATVGNGGNLTKNFVSGTYYLQVLVEDNAGNKKVFVSGAYDLKAVIANGSFNGKVNTPKLMEGMTGVYFDTNGNEVTVTPENQNNWYNYEENKWANAKTKDGSYWVWIPRYEYKITYYTDSNKTITSQNVTKYGKIDIKFIPTSQVTVDNGYTYIHPAFRDGSMTHFMNGEWDEEIPGIWVAKYAAGFQASTTNASNPNVVVNGSEGIMYSDKNYTTYNSFFNTNAISQNLTVLPKMSYPVFKPFTYVYNNISTGDSYTLAKEIAKASNFYGLNSSNTDSHMMKNSEWGAVVYLTNSKYGRNGAEVTINSKNLGNLNSKSIYEITGYENTVAGGVGASSTGNKSGIFDLSGCTWERVAAYISNGNSSISVYGNSYASSTSNENAYKTLSTKYATVYPYDSSSTDNAGNWNRYRILRTQTYGYGDAILETSIAGTSTNSWNGDFAYYPFPAGPFFVRGGAIDSGSGAGIFALDGTSGDPYHAYSFRVVLIGY